MSRQTQFNMHDAKSNLSRLVERVEGGEEITIARHGRPVARLVPVRRENRASEIFGAWSGRVSVSDDFDEPVPELMETIYGPDWRTQVREGSEPAGPDEAADR